MSTLTARQIRARQQQAREYEHHYAYTALLCTGCQHSIGDHDSPIDGQGKCNVEGCECKNVKYPAEKG